MFPIIALGYLRYGVRVKQTDICTDRQRPYRIKRTHFHFVWTFDLFVTEYMTGIEVRFVQLPT